MIPLFEMFLKRKPKRTDPKIAAKSYVIGIFAAYEIRDGFILK